MAKSKTSETQKTAKLTMVTLVVPSLGWSREFSPEHAENLLKMGTRTEWVLPEDSPFEFDGNAIKPRPAKKGVEGE